MTKIRLLLAEANLDVLTISETWLNSSVPLSLVNLDGFKAVRLDRAVRSRSKAKKRGGGLITYISEKYGSSYEALDELDISNEDVEVHWIYLHRPQCKDVVICNLYRPPAGKLEKSH